MSQSLHLVVCAGEHGMRNPTPRLADLLETFAQDLRDQTTGSGLVGVPGYRFTMNGDSLEVLNELP